MAHLTWWQDGDCHNMDAWESEAAFGVFGETRPAPAMQRAGVDAHSEVTFHSAHEVYPPQARAVTAS
jgi:hypothetical protein